MTRTSASAIALLLGLAACGGSDDSAANPGSGTPAPSPTPTPGPAPATGFSTTSIANFDTPWAMAFIGNGPYALVTERGGGMFLVNSTSGAKSAVSGVPTPVVAGQGGLGDIVMAPDTDTSDNRFPIYLSWVEGGNGNTSGAVVARGIFSFDQSKGDGGAISNLSIIWRQDPKVTGTGHFSHRVAIAPDGQHIFISSGERQKGAPAQDMSVNLGKIIRLNLDGSIPADNPFVAQGGITAQIWSYGHRNVLGLAFDDQGRLWASEMGAKGGDEVNLIQRGDNYGWPRASNGSNYDDSDIPDHRAGDGYIAPAAWWNPSISPAGLVYYNSNLFPQWRGSLFSGALSGQALVRLKIEGNALVKADQWPMARIREVEVGPDGALWLLEDANNGRLLKLTPAT